MAHDIFISYSTKDKDTADAVCGYMEDRGIRCWYAPRDILPGADWADSIIKAIDGAKVMILIFTADSNVSKQVLREVDYAVHAGVAVVPLRLSDEQPKDSMRYYLAGAHWLDGTGKDPAESFVKLYDICRAVIDHGASSVLTPGMQGKAAGGRKKTYILAAVIAALVIAGAAAGFFLHSREGGEEGTDATVTGLDMSDSTGDVNTYTSGNSQCNIRNGGHLAYDDGWYYTASDNGLVRMGADGSDRLVLSDKPGGCISVYDGYIYYLISPDYASQDYLKNNDPYDYRIVRFRIDGDNVTSEILSHSYADDVCIINDRLYYRDLGSGAIHSMALDGSDDREENDFTGYDWYCLDGEYMYYVSSDDSMLYRMKMNGEDGEKILDHEVGQPAIADGRLYFPDYTALCTGYYDIESGGHGQVTSAPLSDINVAGHYLIGKTDDGIMRADLTDGSSETFLDGSFYSICVSGEKLYFWDMKPYVINLDGSGLTEI